MNSRALLLALFLPPVGLAGVHSHAARSAGRCASVPDSVTLRSRVTKWFRASATVLSGEAIELGIILNGSIRSVSDTTIDGPIGARVVTTRWWKGERQDTITVIWQPSRRRVVTEVFPLEVGQRYVLFLPHDGPPYWSWGCGGSAGGARADTIVALLDSLSR